MYVLMLLLLFVLGLIFLLGSVGFLCRRRNMLAIATVSTLRSGAFPRAAWAEQSILWRSLPRGPAPFGFFLPASVDHCADGAPKLRSSRTPISLLKPESPTIPTPAELHSSHFSRSIASAAAFQ